MRIFGDAMNRWRGRRLEAIQVDGALDSCHTLGHRMPVVHTLRLSLPLSLERFLVIELDPYRPTGCAVIRNRFRVGFLTRPRSPTGQAFDAASTIRIRFGRIGHNGIARCLWFQLAGGATAPPTFYPRHRFTIRPDPFVGRRSPDFPHWTKKRVMPILVAEALGHKDTRSSKRG